LLSKVCSWRLMRVADFVNCSEMLWVCDV